MGGGKIEENSRKFAWPFYDPSTVRIIKENWPGQGEALKETMKDLIESSLGGNGQVCGATCGHDGFDGCGRKLYGLLRFKIDKIL